MKNIKTCLIFVVVCITSYNHDISAQTCTVTVPITRTFADVSDLESFLSSEVGSTPCSEININGSIRIDCSTSPTSLNFQGIYLDLVTNISDNLTVSFCPSVTEILGFSNLTYIGNYVQFSFNDNLLSIDGFISLCELNALLVDNNYLLESLTGFQNLTRANSFFEISFNEQLVVLNEFSSLTIVGDFFIWDNYELETIGGFPKLTNVTGYFDIVNNLKLIDIGVFDNLTSVSGGMAFLYNTTINSINTFSSLCSVGQYFFLDQNHLLETCCSFQNLFEFGDIAGSVSITDNSTGCNSVEEISNNSQCGEMAPISTCLSEFSLPLNSCGKAILSPCMLINGPCCGYQAQINGEPFDLYEFTSEDEGTFEVTLLKDGESCTVNLRVGEMVEAIPTIRTWGIFCLGLLIMIFGVSSLKTYSQIEQNKLL